MVGRVWARVGASGLSPAGGRLGQLASGTPKRKTEPGRGGEASADRAPIHGAAPVSDRWSGLSMAPADTPGPPRQGGGRARLCCQAEVPADGPRQGRGLEQGGENFLLQ